MAFMRTGPFSRTVIPDRPSSPALRNSGSTGNFVGGGTRGGFKAEQPQKAKPLINKGELAGLAQEQQAPAEAGQGEP